MGDEIQMETEIENNHFYSPDGWQDEKKRREVRNKMQSEKISDEKRRHKQERVFDANARHYPRAGVGKSDKNQGSDQVMGNDPGDGIAKPI